MKILKLLAILFFISVLTAPAIAQEHLPKLTMTVTLINTSNETIAYTGVTDTNTENIFLVSPKIVLPGAQVRVTSVSNNYNVPDLSGNLHFATSEGKSVVLHVTDPRQIHIGKTIPAQGNDKYIPTVFAAPSNPLFVTDSTATMI
jgi:hypothetical protein